MLIINTITMAIDRQQMPPVIDAVQGEANSRAIKIQLTNGGQPWSVPSDVSCLVRFGKPDKTGGIYDTLEDGTRAVEIGENYLQFLLAEQVVSFPGDVFVQVEMTKNGASLSTFSVVVRVQEDKSIGALESKDYYNLRRYVYEEVKNILGDDTPTNGMTVTFSGNANSGYSADKTYEEIDDAHNEGFSICGVLTGSSADVVLGDIIAEKEQGYYSFSGQVRRYAGGKSIPIESWTAILHSDDTVEVFQEKIVTTDTAPVKLPNPNALTIDEVSYDGSVKVDMTEAVGAVVERKMMSVKRAGAKGDGSTDDTAAFQKAMSESRVVYVPGGTYKLSDTLVIKENSGLILSQDTVLKFLQTEENCIEMRGSAVLRGNHGILQAAYGLTGHVIDMDTLKDGTDHATSIPPYEKSSPMFKRQRFVYDVNIIKPMDYYGGIGSCKSADGKCNGTAIYMSATNVSNTSTDIPWMWAINISGVRIAGGFSYGIHAINYDSAAGSSGHYEDDGWNHDMRIEAVIEQCEIGVALENCNGAHLSVTIQPGTAQNNGAKYAKNGVYLKDSRFVDMMRSRVWDWHHARDDSEEFKHIALYGNCRGLLLDDYLVTEHPNVDIRSDIYTDTPSNFDTMVILQEPANKWFKSVDNKPYFFDGTANRSLRLKSDKITAEDTTFVHSASGGYVYEPKFTNLVPTSIDTNGSVYNGKGYRLNCGMNNSGGEAPDTTSCMITGFMPISGGYHTYRVAGNNIGFNRYGCNICFYDSNYTKLKVITYDKIGTSKYYGTLTTEETTLLTWTTDANVTGIENAAYIRVSVAGQCPDLVVTVDEKVEYDATWQGEPQRMDESIYAQGVVLKSPSGKVFKLTIDDSGNITPTEFTE